MVFCPSDWKPVAITAGSKVREDCDGSFGGTATKFAPVARISNIFLLSLMQSIVVPDELGEARHLHSCEQHCSCTGWTIGKDIHQTGVAAREQVAALDAVSDVIVDTSYLVRFTRRECAESLEFGTDGGWISSNQFAAMRGRRT